MPKALEEIIADGNDGGTCFDCKRLGIADSTPISMGAQRAPVYCHRERVTA